MQCTIGWTNRQRRWGAVVHTIAVWGLIVLPLMTGAPVESIGGWWAYPPPVIELAEGRRTHRRGSCRWSFAWRVGWYWMRRSWVVAAVRSEALLALVCLTDRQAWAGLGLLPWVAWLWKGIGIAWPALGYQPWYEGMSQVWERACGVLLLGLGVMWLGERLAVPEGHGVGGLGYGVRMLPVGLCVQSEADELQVEVAQDEAGVYHVRLRGEFVLHVDGKVAFYTRMLIIFLGLLEVPGATRGSRRTRDGRTPWVRQEQLAAWFGVPGPVISRWCAYWLQQDWRRMLSQRGGEVLTEEVRQWVIDRWASCPWWSAQRLWEHLRAQGRTISLRQVQQIGRESGWTRLRQRLQQHYQISAESFRPRDEWLSEQLLGLVQQLVERLEAVGGLTDEQQIEIADLETLGQELHLTPARSHRPLPWVLRVERLLLGRWEPVDDGLVRCIYCGSTEVSRKSRQPRWKRYVDEQGTEQQVAVYRYYCHNLACSYQTFTNLPPNLIPYSKWTLDHHLVALQTYEWAHGLYRCTSQMLGVSKMTAYRWVSGFGFQLLPVAALFGVVRCSGVVGVDEKYVLVPKNDKPEGDRKRWMYVYFAVDGYTYDLLHIEIYPYNTKQSARTFLLALRAQGYHPRVVVTDMRVDYRDVVADVFPKAVHHECIFHALQEARKHAQEIYGTDYAQTCPEVQRLLEEIDRIFDARSKRTAQQRYEKVLAQRETFITSTPEAAAIFDFLERHWPYLVNAIESQLIPTTNNAVEEVIRIFTQHYKTFCGFENVESARLYLGVFEKVYRFTPFSDDAQARIRGKCPLELAGYEVQKLPMAQLFRGLALQWPASAFQELVPNV